MNKYLLIIISLSLSGCISDYADNQCRSAGFAPGSSDYNSCFNKIAQEQQRCMMILSQAQLSGANGLQEAMILQQSGCN